MQFKIKNSFIFGHLSNFHLCEKLGGGGNFQPGPAKNDHFIGSTRESLD